MIVLPGQSPRSSSLAWVVIAFSPVLRLTNSPGMTAMSAWSSVAWGLARAISQRTKPSTGCPFFISS